MTHTGTYPDPDLHARLEEFLEFNIAPVVVHPRPEGATFDLPVVESPEVSATSTETCNKCGEEYTVGAWPFCPHGRGSYGVQDDSIPGGLEIKNGLCNPDGSPRKYYSQTEIKAEAKRRGMENHVVHIGAKGSDKSRITTRWI